MRRSALTLALLVAVAAVAVASVSAAAPPTADLAGLQRVSQNASYFSVCISATPVPGPSVAPPASPLPIPVIDAPTAALQFEVKAGMDQSCVAWGFHEDTIEAVGWGYLSIESNAAFPDYTQSRAAGYLEGWLCAERIYQTTLIDLPSAYPNGVPSAAVLAFLNQTVNFKTGMIANVAAYSPYWSQIANLYLQLQGLWEGYTAVNTDPAMALSWFALYSLQLDVDIGDITTAVGLYSELATEEERLVAQTKMAARQNHKPSDNTADLYTHCSSLVKVLENNSDILIGHSTWSGFNTMLRTFKLYTLPLRVSLGSISVHMSSYPGYLFSSDDWYQMLPSMLTVTETTNDLYNPALYALIQSGSVSLWARTLVANRLATSGPSYAEILGRYNSGTCNNQWIILDHKLFTAGAALQPNLLTIAEQMPGLVSTRDVTPSLINTGFWYNRQTQRPDASSFNIPALEITYNVSGYNTGCISPYGTWACGYIGNFRQVLFEHLAPTVVDLPSMQSVMMYNEWQTDPLQRGGAGWAIAARDDLRTVGGSAQAYGALDSKITSDSWMKAGSLRVSTTCGPTHMTQAPFCWTGQWASQQPKGQPLCFDFPWVQYAVGEEMQIQSEEDDEEQRAMEQ